MAEPIPVTLGGRGVFTCPNPDCTQWGDRITVQRHIDNCKDWHPSLPPGDNNRHAYGGSGNSLTDYGMAAACVDTKRKIRKDAFITSIGGESKLYQTLFNTFVSEARKNRLDYPFRTLVALLYYYGFDMFKKHEDTLLAVHTVNSFAQLNNIKERQTEEVLRSLIFKSIEATRIAHNGDFNLELRTLFCTRGK
jgi:hypothetical protein